MQGMDDPLNCQQCCRELYESQLILTCPCSAIALHGEWHILRILAVNFVSLLYSEREDNSQGRVACSTQNSMTNLTLNTLNPHFGVSVEL